MASLDLDSVLKDFRDLAREKDWQRFHSPKNLASAVSVEAAELLEIFQWLDEQGSRDLKDDGEQKAAVAAEVADILMYLLALCDKLDIDVPAAVAAKIEHNRRRFLGGED